jgi:hypothetical protein
MEIDSYKLLFIFTSKKTYVEKKKEGAGSESVELEFISRSQTVECFCM